MVDFTIDVFPVESMAYTRCLVTSFHGLLVGNHKVDFVMWSFKKLWARQKT